MMCHQTCRLLILPLLTLIGMASLIRAEDATAASPENIPKDKNAFHLFLLVGQSNMAGRGELTPRDQEPHPRVWMLNKERNWLPATDPLHFDKPAAVGVGLGKTFASDYADAHPDVHVGLIPCAVGGSAIASWEPGGHHDPTQSHPYDDAVERAKHALQNGTLKGILWHQGESDAKPDRAKVYERKLHALIKRLRTTLDAPQVPFVAGQMGQFAERPWSEAKHQVDAAHQRLSEKVPSTAFVSSEGLSHKGDQVHFDAASYRELGHRYFHAFQSVLQH